mmetsp:Transcript_6237/g.9312  ORF Transcript_6237/g.9312 Transcript_6237/m.9312 type:complete len:191 (+) Transcript_6237:123-695(+)
MAPTQLADYLQRKSVNQNIAGRDLKSLSANSMQPASFSGVNHLSRPTTLPSGSGDESDDSVLNEEEELLLDRLMANQNSSLVLHDVSGDRTKHANLHSGNNLQAILQPSARYFDNSYQEGAVGRSDNRNNVDRGGGASIDLYVAETPKSPPGKTPRHLLEMQLIQERQYLQVDAARSAQQNLVAWHPPPP